MINVLVDLGNYNVKFLGENKGMFSSKYSTRFNTKGKNYIEEEIERLIKNGRIKVEPKVYLSFLKDILNRTKSRINITDYEVVFVGGGASLLKVYIEANTPGVVCEDSIFANLNGAQKLCEVMWRGN